MGIGWAGRQITGTGVVNFPPGDFKVASRYKNNCGVDLTITSLYGHWLLSGSYSSFHAKGLVYSDVSSLPSALLQVSNEITAIGVGAVAMPFATPWIWPAGEWRWLGVIADTTLVTQSICATGVTNGIRYIADTYSDGPSDPYGSASAVDFEYILWAEGYDGAQKLGRIAFADGRTDGNYFKWCPHYERFELGVNTAPLFGATTIAITQMAVYVTTSMSVNTHCAIYADDGGVTGKPVGATLLGVSDALSSATANTWLIYPFSTPLTLTAGQYWLAFVGDTSGLGTNVTNYNGQESSAGAAQIDPTYYTFQNPVVEPPSLFDQRPFGLSIYAEYTLVDPPAVASGYSQLSMMPRAPWRPVAY